MLNLKINWLVMRNLWQWRVTFILFIRSEGCGIHVAKSICIWAIWDFGVSNSKLQPTRCNFFLFIYFYKRSTFFRRFLCPSSGAHNCTYSFRYCQLVLLLAATMEEMASISSMVAANSSIGWQYLKLYVWLCAPDDGQRNSLKHVERL
jgi:hypothetical protein